MIKYFLLRKLSLFTEIFEFDAMDDPPSVLDVEVYDFDGPCDKAASLGRVEINFLKTNISDLADIWVSLEGKLALACHSKLHLKVFLNNTRGGDVVKHYISKMEKEVGKKVRIHLCCLAFVFIFNFFCTSVLSPFSVFFLFFYLQNCRLICGLLKQIQHRRRVIHCIKFKNFCKERQFSQEYFIIVGPFV